MANNYIRVLFHVQSCCFIFKIYIPFDSVVESSAPGTFQYVSPENFREYYLNGKKKQDFEEDSEDEGKPTHIRSV